MGKIHYKVNPSWTGSKVAFYLENPLYLGTGFQISCSNNVSTGIYSSGGTFGVSGLATGIPSGGGGTLDGVKGDANGTNNTQATPSFNNGNAGVFGTTSACQNGAWNSGVFGSSTLNQTGVSNNGTYGRATGGTNAYGAYGYGSGATNSYGVVGETQGTSNGATVENYAGKFFGDISITGSGWATGGMIVTSDSTVKNDIVEIQDALALLSKMHGYTYKFDTENYPGLNLPEGDHMGLISQEVEPYFPDAVKLLSEPARYDTAGNIISEAIKLKGLEYNGIVAALVEAVNELNAKVDGCCSNQMRTQDQGSNPIQEISLMSESLPLLGDCTPNPNDGKTKITVRVPQSVANAEIVFTDQLGKEVSRIAITNRGYSDLEITTAGLENGVYHFSLLVDGKLIDSKQMVKQH